LRAIPAPTRDLTLRQQGTNVLFELTYPKTSAGGQALDGIFERSGVSARGSEEGGHQQGPHHS